MQGTQSPSLFADLSTLETQTIQGGCYRRGSYRPSYYYYRPSAVSYYPSYSYDYGYGGYGQQGSSTAVNQTVNVNVLYDD